MNLRLLLRIIITDKNNNVISDTGEMPSHSFTQNLVNMLTTFFISQTLCLSTTNASRYVPSTESNLTLSTIMATNGGVNDDTKGIIVGIGVGAENNLNYSLTQIMDGIAGGELVYGNQHWTWIGDTGADVRFIISRSFSNMSGGAVTINEVGIQYRSRGSYFVNPNWFNEDFYGIFARDLVTKTVNDGECATVQYIFSTTV